MMFSAEQLALATQGHLVTGGTRGRVCTDTRKVQAGDWFLAIRGERFDAHEFLAQAVDAGATGVIAEQVPDGWSAGLITVKDGLDALQDLARFVRNQFNGPVVGITGSAGKTTTRAIPCPSGTFKEGRLCRALRTCSAAQYQSVAPTLSSDRVCEQHPVCSATQWEERPASSHQPRICQDLAACANDEYESVVPTVSSNRECASHSQCTSEQHQTLAPSATNDRGCTALTVCGELQFESTAPTAMSDRGCTDRTVCAAPHATCAIGTPANGGNGTGSLRMGFSSFLSPDSSGGAPAPSPSCPWLLRPKAQTRPSLERHSEW
jgi:hypothetical protein